jgi:hypothetical protein
VFLAEAHWRRGDIAAGLTAIDDGLRVAEGSLDRSYWAELWRWRGELLGAAGRRGRDARHGNGHDPAAPEACCARALEIARAAGAKSLELRAATSLARAAAASERGREAWAMLGELCAGFGREHTSPDLTDARAVLDALTAPSTAPRPRRSAGPSKRASRFPRTF